LEIVGSIKPIPNQMIVFLTFINFFENLKTFTHEKNTLHPFSFLQFLCCNAPNPGNLPAIGLKPNGLNKSIRPTPFA
jgi:hypothetical protein